MISWNRHGASPPMNLHNKLESAASSRYQFTVCHYKSIAHASDTTQSQNVIYRCSKQSKKVCARSVCQRRRIPRLLFILPQDSPAFFFTVCTPFVSLTRMKLGTDIVEKAMPDYRESWFWYAFPATGKTTLCLVIIPRISVIIFFSSIVSANHWPNALVFVVVCSCSTSPQIPVSISRLRRTLHSTTP